MPSGMLIMLVRKNPEKSSVAPLRDCMGNFVLLFRSVSLYNQYKYTESEGVTFQHKIISLVNVYVICNFIGRNTNNYAVANNLHFLSPTCHICSSALNMY